MECFKPALIKNDSFWLGQSKRNLHVYAEVPTAVVEVEDKNLVDKSRVPRLNQKLYAECRQYNLPVIFAKCLGRHVRSSAVLSGRRAIYIPQIYRMNLKDLGWSSRDIIQEFVVDVKGSGIRLSDSERISVADFRKFAEKHQINLDDSPNQLVFSRNKYIDFESPEGSQREGNLYSSIVTFEHFAERGFKLAPIICGVTYPKKIQRLAAEFDKEPIDTELGQERRLMPSFVRATYFEHNSGREQQLLGLISPERRVLEKLENILLRDIRPYFKTLVTDTIYEDGVYSWSHLGDIERLFDEPNRLYDKEYSWFIAKDLVVAPTGIYFVDMDSGCAIRKTAHKDKLMARQQIYLTCLLKDFFRLAANYSLALNNGKSSPRDVEADARKKVIKSINECKGIEIKEAGDRFEISLNPKTIGELHYSINKSHLPLVR